MSAGRAGRHLWLREACQNKWGGKWVWVQVGGGVEQQGPGLGTEPGPVQQRLHSTFQSTQAAGEQSEYC